MITAYIYNGKDLKVYEDAGDFSKETVKRDKIWINITESDEKELNGVLKSLFNFHPLSIEDCSKEMQYPKIDDYGEYLFMVIHAPDLNHLETFETVEVDIFLGSNYLVTYSRSPVKSIDTLKERCIRNPGSLFKQGMDMMFYNLVDSTMDNYNYILNFLDKKIEKVEDDVVEGEISVSLKDIILLRNDLKEVRRIQVPQRELFNKLSHRKFNPIMDKTRIYMSDTYDAMYRINDTIDNLRDYIDSVRDIYMTVESNRMNQVMKTLTVIATIMMPFVVIASIYGMNINLPLSKSPYSFLLIMAITLVITAFLMLWFKRKNWF